MRNGRAILGAAFALSLASFAARADFSADSISDPVACAARPGQTYALYLPPGWSAGRELPVLYVLDVRGRGAAALEVFRPAAARLGWILASSNTSATGVAASRNAEALDAMWQDTQARLRLGPRRRYVAGFSGTARFAALAGLAFKGEVAGVFGAGAGFPAELPPRPGMPFVYFGSVGDEDFNFAEMRTLDRRLDELGTSHRLVVFEGGHRWPPPEVVLEGLEWLEACASAGCPPEPPASKEVLKRRRREAGEDERELGTIAALDADLKEILRKEPLPTAERAASVLGLDRWKKRAAGSSSEDAKSARRLLAWVRAKTGFELAGEYDGKEDAPRAALCRALAESAR